MELAGRLTGPADQRKEYDGRAHPVHHMVGAAHAATGRWAQLRPRRARPHTCLRAAGTADAGAGATTSCHCSAVISRVLAARSLPKLAGYVGQQARQCTTQVAARCCLRAPQGRPRRGHGPAAAAAAMAHAPTTAPTSEPPPTEPPPAEPPPTEPPPADIATCRAAAAAVAAAARPDHIAVAATPAPPHAGRREPRPAARGNAN